MVSTYSPQRDAVSSLHMTSPVHPAQLDPVSAIREIRRSLSRSPSKGQFCLRSQSPSIGNMPFSPSPLSPSRRSASDNFLPISCMASPQQGRLSQTGRVHRPAVRRGPQTQPSLFPRTSPKSPSKRVLTDSSDSGNSSPMPRRKRSSTEVDREDALGGGNVTEEQENHMVGVESDAAWKPISRQEKRRSSGFNTSAPLSPMKRSDAPIDLDHPSFRSPSAKRRSLHGPGLDFSIFDQDSLSSAEIDEERRAQDDNDWFRYASPLNSSRFSTIPRRSSSLRKSTLQQRQNERSSSSKFSLFVDTDTASPAATPALANVKKGARISLDNHLPPMQRDSPFSSQGNLLSASIHPVGSTQVSQAHHIRHPLSRTMTQSSSASDVQDESPTHEPVHRLDRPRSHDFAKSLPIGAYRPDAFFHSDDTQDMSSQGSFATPGNYKNARPLAAAFMSTGLISKKNRNVNEPNAGLPKAHMPDTPCKKQAPAFPADVRFVPGKGNIGVKSNRHSFGTPSTPFGTPHINVKATPLPFAKLAGNIFSNDAINPTTHRRMSFASVGEGTHRSQSPTAQTDSQSTDAEFPPTPTKHAAADASRYTGVSPSPHRQSILLGSYCGSASAQATHFSSSKLSPIRASPGSVDGDSDSVMEDSPSASLRPNSSLTMLSVQSTSFTRGRGLKSLNSPTPLSRQALAVPLFHSPRSGRAKLASLSPVSPRQDKVDRHSPHTPHEGIFPPDPSGLSITGRNERLALRPGSSSACAVPATPTGPRDYFQNFSNRPSLNLTAPDTTEVDQSLKSRFERTELVGTGEFSQVYRVSQPPQTSPFHKIYTISSTRSSSRSSLPERVWAVKKSRQPYTGAKDRQRKVHEVDVLKALGHSDHILGFVDSWEEKGHLYIQTEFCEEGTLDIFLASVGIKARLDDFRIWKILLEMALGLKHIHESGFIHLDLKPANVLITFEGVLKIADFGMAAKWPANSGIEGEGDREYIGPEILMGRYDKPADVFALGLIMLETAGNVELPDNGASWQKLRNGDMSDVPSLTWTSDASNIFRDASGNPLPEEAAAEESEGFEKHDSVKVITSASGNDDSLHHRRKSIHLERSGELTIPPAFMVDASHEQALDGIVRWMISPDPAHRPLASEVLCTVGVQWAETRRRAGATVFEGNWGPADEVLAEDAEMIDV